MALFGRDFFLLSNWIITMADPRRLLWHFVRSGVRRLFRERDTDLAEQMHAHIASLQKPFCDSSDRGPEQAFLTRGDQNRLSDPKLSSMPVVPDPEGPPSIHPAALRTINDMDALSRAVLILCVLHHVPPNEIARRFGTTRRRVRKHLRLAVSAIAAMRDHAEP